MLSIFKKKRSGALKQESEKKPNRAETPTAILSSRKIGERKVSAPSKPFSSKSRWLEAVIGFEEMDRSASLDDFTMVKILGKGSFGKVIAISSKKTGKQYAMKIISKKMVMKYKMVKQIMNEIKIMKNLTHENIIRYQTHFEDNEYIFLLLDLADKGSLFSKLKKKGILNEQEAAKVMFEILKAVSYLHNEEPPIIHRDIKPENILFVGKTVKLADFGWSNTKDILRSTYCGTRDYLAPEMILKKGHDEKLDVWTLGVLMFEICTGKTPFSPNGINKRPDVVRVELEENILKKDPEFPNFLSMNARDLINQLLKKNPEERLSCTTALKHPWFRTNGFRYNAEKERVLYNIISKSKKQLNRKKIRRILSQDKEKPQTERLNKTENLENNNINNTLNTFDILKDKIARKSKLRRRTKNKSIDEMTLTTMLEYSKKDPVVAIEELSIKYTRAREEKDQLSKIVNLKSDHIKELEEELRELKSKVIYKKNGSIYTKSEIMFMEGQMNLNKLSEDRIEELEERFKMVTEENDKLIRESRELRLSTELSLGDNMSGDIKNLLKEIKAKLANSEEIGVVNQVTSSEDDGKLIERVTILTKMLENYTTKEENKSKNIEELRFENQKLKEKLENMELKFKLRGFKPSDSEEIRDYKDTIKELRMELEMKDKELGYVKRSLTQANNVIEIMHRSQKNN